MTTEHNSNTPMGAARASLFTLESILLLLGFTTFCVVAYLWVRSLYHWLWLGRSAGANSSGGEDLPSRADMERIAATLRRRQPTVTSDTSSQSAPAALEDKTCSICFDEMVSAVELLPCGHTFCAPCVDQWWSSLGRYRRVRCPLCRTLAELIVPAYRVRETSGERPEQPDTDAGIRTYNATFSSSPVTVRGFYSQVMNVLLNQRFLPIMIRIRIFTMVAASLVYLVSPFDLLSESAVGVIGFLDDAVFIAIALWFIFRAAHRVASR